VNRDPLQTYCDRPRVERGADRGVELAGIGGRRVRRCVHLQERDNVSLAGPGAFAGTAAVRCDVAAPAITGAKLLRNGLENVTFTGRQL